MQSKCQSLSRVRLFATPWTVARPGSSVQGILQAQILEWVAIPFSRGSSRPRDQTWVSCIGRWNLYHPSHQGSRNLVFKLEVYQKPSTG